MIRSDAVKEHLAKRREELAERDQKRLEEQAERTLRVMKRRAEQEFLAAGGDPNDFESAWPELRDELLKDAVRRKVAQTLPALRL